MFAKFNGGFLRKWEFAKFFAGMQLENELQDLKDQLQSEGKSDGEIEKELG